MAHDMSGAAAKRRGRAARAAGPADELGVCVLHPEDRPNPKPARGPLPPAIGPRLRDVRLAKGLTLGDVEQLSGISKSMLSQIERGRVNPTFATLWNLTRSLEVAIGDLLDEVSASAGEPRPYEHVTVELTPVISNGDGFSFTRVLSPRRYPYPVEWYEMVLRPGGARRAHAHGNGAWEHMTVIVGEVVVEIGERDVALKAGETVRYSGDQPHGVRNESATTAHVMLVVVPYPPVDSFLPVGDPFGA